MPIQQPEIEDLTDANWLPEPIDAGPGVYYLSMVVLFALLGLLLNSLLYAEFKANKPSDVLSTLVSIYDSKDFFVKELQVLLAQRLLAITDVSDVARVDKEVSGARCFSLYDHISLEGLFPWLHTDK